MRRYLAIILTVLLCFASKAQAQSDGMDSLSSGPVRETPKEAQVRFIPPETPVQIGVPFPLRLQVLVPGDFSEMQISHDPNGVYYLIGEKFRKISPTEFVASYRVRKAGEWAFKPTVRALPEGATEPLELVSEGFTLKVDRPAQEESGELKPYPELRELPFDYTWRNVILTAVGIVLFVLIVVLTILLVRYSRRPRAAVAGPPPTPAILVAIAEVRELAGLEIFRLKGVDPHYTALSMALRRYLEHQFGVPAIEMTEDEVIDFVRRNLDTMQHTEVLRQLFTRSSLAKFAQQAITSETAREDVDSAITFLERERARLDASAAHKGRATESGERAA